MITIKDIITASDTNELDDLVELAAKDRGIELNPSFSYLDNAVWIREAAHQLYEYDMAEILEAAENHWCRLEGIQL